MFPIKFAFMLYNPLKGTVSLISSVPSCKNTYSRFKTVHLKTLFNQ